MGAKIKVGSRGTQIHWTHPVRAYRLYSRTFTHFHRASASAALSTAVPVRILEPPHTLHTISNASITEPM